MAVRVLSQGMILMSQTEGDNASDRLMHSIISSEIDFCMMFVTAAERAYQGGDINRGNETAAKAKEIYERTMKLVEHANIDSQKKSSADLDRIRRSLDRLSVRS
jgi:hypothetical protein